MNSVNFYQIADSLHLNYCNIIARKINYKKQGSKFPKHIIRKRYPTCYVAYKIQKSINAPVNKIYINYSTRKRQYIWQLDKYIYIYIVPGNIKTACTWILMLDKFSHRNLKQLNINDNRIAFQYKTLSNLNTVYNMFTYPSHRIQI